MAPQIRILLAIFIVAMWSSYTSASLSDYCLRCICQKTRGCSCSGDKGCGPFNIEESFMSPGAAMSYHECKADAVCSRNAFQDFVDQFELRESSRGISKCELASRIQRGGAVGSNSRAADTFWLLVQSCMINE
nr:lysozyme 2-like [Lytechinus pictus]